MGYIIADACTKDNECIEACPVDCIHPTEDEDGYEEAEQLYIHPEECIDCGACVPVCPSETIFELDDVPADKHEYIAKNAAYYDM